MSLYQIVVQASKASISNSQLILSNVNSEVLILKTSNKTQVKTISPSFLISEWKAFGLSQGFINGSQDCEIRFANFKLSTPRFSSQGLIFDLSEFKDLDFNLSQKIESWDGQGQLRDITLRITRTKDDFDFTQFQLFAKKSTFSGGKLVLSGVTINVLYFQSGVEPFAVPVVQPQSLHVFLQNFANNYPLITPFALAQDKKRAVTLRVSNPVFENEQLFFDYDCLSSSDELRNLSLFITGPAVPLKSEFLDILGIRIFTQRYGDGKGKRVLVVNGGPGADYEYTKNLSNLYTRGITVYFYSQAGTFPSGSLPNLTDYTVEYYAKELEEIRQKLKIRGKNSYILSQSFGGLIVYQWADQFTDRIKEVGGLVFSNTGYSVPEYIDYINVIISTFPPKVQAELKAFQEKEDFTNPRYVQLVNEYFNYVYVCQIVPYPINLQLTLERINQPLFNYLQGPNEIDITGTLKDFDQSQVLPKISVPSLFITSVFDYFDPKQALIASKTVRQGTFAETSGSHIPGLDRPDEYFRILIDFFRSN